MPRNDNPSNRRSHPLSHRRSHPLDIVGFTLRGETSRRSATTTVITSIIGPCTTVMACGPSIATEGDGYAKLNRPPEWAAGSLATIYPP